MKKILGAIFIVVFAVSASFALTPGKISLGIGSSAANLGAANFGALYVGYNFTNQIAGKLGLNYSNGKFLGGADNSQVGLSLQADFMLPMTWGAANPLVGLRYSTDGATAATSIISLVLGIEAEIADNVVLGAGLTPYSTASMSGASDSTINTGTDNQNGRGIYWSLAVGLN